MGKEKQVNEAAASQAEPVVSEVGAGQEARRVVRVGSWELTAWTGKGDEEPRVRDVDLAQRLGLDRPRDIRKLVERHLNAGNLNDFDIRATVARNGDPRGRGRPGTEFWLTEAAALFIASKSETPQAVSVTKEMIRVFMLARRGLLPGQRAGISEEHVRGIVAVMCGEAIVPFVRELADLRRALAERTDGVITTHQGDELRRQIGSVARDLVDLGDYETLRAAKTAVDQQIKAASGWGGTGRVRWAMPASRYAEALAALRALQQQAERRLRRARRPKPQPERGQLHLNMN